jgi:alkanesulfonate monooxygenase SsuD/methylene tetrahydromethanopterin reductase-like flavin-dependent oxidoreductase (luciferase family)
MGGRNTDEIEVSEMIVLVHNMPKERQNFFFQSVARAGQTTLDKAGDRMTIGSRQRSIERVERFIKAGITHFIFLRIAPHIVGDEIQAFAEEVVPKFRQ